MSSRAQVIMSDEEIATFLGENHKLQVASLGPDGAPHLTTLFYIVREGAVAFWTFGRSQKIKNLERDPRVSALVEDGTDYFELRGVSINGRAEIVRDLDQIRSIGREVVTRMLAAESVESLGDLGSDMVENQVVKRVAVIVHPDHIASWDHRKLVG